MSCPFFFFSPLCFFSPFFLLLLPVFRFIARFVIGVTRVRTCAPLCVELLRYIIKIIYARLMVRKNELKRFNSFSTTSDRFFFILFLFWNCVDFRWITNFTCTRNVYWINPSQYRVYYVYSFYIYIYIYVLYLLRDKNRNNRAILRLDSLQPINLVLFYLFY